ncbi:MAG: Acryloyl-CoA reductase electron transfer subunit gamma [Acidobacteria bacterium ADurb.Bin340]|nr:MAG: Acryloyl-CoA reductase electron transfer subunit gamma [Acidobacteria bacterium ADurb.Bin340]HOD32735.1 electron transfer flavoprotein subunit beta/FixA family protein [Holophaga sp.]HQL47070.1 electron transfer flavoprotein subunit beta/FixA family protein [Holophaga sp.]
MKIVVCVKQVPDTTEVRIDPATGTLIRDGVPSIINPDDRAALETALVLKDTTGATVAVLSMGPPQAEAVLREALAMGADEAILVSDRRFGGSDTWATSLTLASALRRLQADLVLCGRQAIDGDTAQVGPQVAEHLGLPLVSYVGSLRPEGDRHLIVKRMFEDGHHVLRVQMPCLLTILKDMNTPRYMSAPGIFEAFQRPITTWTLDDLDVDPSQIGLKGSPTRVKKSYTKGTKSAGKVYEVDPREGARIIVENLREKFII